MSPVLRLLASLALAASLGSPANAAEHSYPGIVADDIEHVLTTPSRWETPEWQRIGWVAAAVVGTALFIDQPLRDEMRRHDGNNTFITQVERFGAQYAAGVIGGFYLGGLLLEDDKAIHTAQDSLAASLIASGLITPSLKLLTGRSRPREDVGRFHFKPFNDLNASFPSGHTTEAFTLAAVISSHYEDTWVSVCTYSVASMVGAARIYHHAHFASDVLLGATIGTWVGNSIVARNAGLRSHQLSLLPELAPGLIGVRLTGTL